MREGRARARWFAAETRHGARLQDRQRRGDHTPARGRKRPDAPLRRRVPAHVACRTGDVVPPGACRSPAAGKDAEAAGARGPPDTRATPSRTGEPRALRPARHSPGPERNKPWRPRLHTHAMTRAPAAHRRPPKQDGHTRPPDGSDSRASPLPRRNEPSASPTSARRGRQCALSPPEQGSHRLHRPPSRNRTSPTPHQHPRAPPAPPDPTAHRAGSGRAARPASTRTPHRQQPRTLRAAAQPAGRRTLGGALAGGRPWGPGESRGSGGHAVMVICRGGRVTLGGRGKGPRG